MCPTIITDPIELSVFMTQVIAIKKPDATMTLQPHGEKSQHKESLTVC